MADHEKTNISVEPIWFATQRVLRTVVQVGIPAFLTFAGVLPTIIAALGLPVDGKVYLWLVSAATVVTAVAAGLSRVMAIPTVNEWLTHIGLGSVPKAAAQRQAVAEHAGHVSPAQIIDGSDQVNS
jgi:hypothetical protein